MDCGRIGVSGGVVLGAVVLVAACGVDPATDQPRVPPGQAGAPEEQAVGPALSHVVTVSHHEAMNVARAVDAAGRLFAAHRPAPGDRLRVSRLDEAGAAWVPIAGALNERPAAHLVTIAFDRQGVLHVAFLQERAGGDSFELVVRRVEGGAWQDCAQRLDVGAAQFFFKADLAFDDRNRLLLAYPDQGGRLRVERRENDGWVSLGALGTRRYGPRMVIKPDGQPAIAYLQSHDDSDEITLEVIARDGDRWASVAGTVDRSSSLGELLSPPRLSWDGSGVWLAWTRGDEVRVARRTGPGWEHLTPALEARGGRIAFALVDGEPLIVAAVDRGFDTRARRFRGRAWDPAFDVSPAGATGLGTGPVLATGAGSAYLAFPGLGEGARCPVERLRFAAAIP